MPRVSAADYKAMAERAEKDRMLLHQALGDALGKGFEAAEQVKVKADGDLYTFRISRSDAPHGGLLTVTVSNRTTKHPWVTVHYLSEVSRYPEIQQFPRETWGAIEQLRVKAFQIATGSTG